ncbi:MAG: protein translocase subunit SecDF, partial [Bacteroidota bacterium]
MQGKGLIKFFLVALVAITFYQLFLMLPTRKVEKRAAEQATKVAGENNPDNPIWKAEEVRYLDSMSSETVLNLGFVKMNYQDLKSKQLALGLDLKGGMSVVMQVDLSEFLNALSDNSKNEKFLTAIQQARDQESNAQDDFITLFYNEWKKVADGENLASVFAFNQALKDRINFNSS